VHLFAATRCAALTLGPAGFCTFACVVAEGYSAYLHQTANKIAKRDAGPRINVWRDARDAYKHILLTAHPLDWEAEPEARALAATSPAARRMVDNVAFVR
jgi:hypothetical protein